MKKNQYITILLLILVGAGCIEKELEPAPTVGHADPIVSYEEAIAFPDEPIEVKVMAMPCLAFSYNEGFLKWVDAYIQGDSDPAKMMADRLGLPEKADLKLMQILKISHPDGSTKTNICLIHKQAGIISWAVEFNDSTSIYSYRNGVYSTISVKSHLLEKDQFCLPRIITDTKLQWICKDQNEPNWQQVHVQRKTGQIDVIDCIREKNGEQVEPGLGCIEL